MTSFTPLNIIPDSDSEAEVDNTEEIQIEEALKLYQQALRFHTDGAWEEAHKAYEELFRSEIFQLDVEEQVHRRNSNVASSLPLVHYLSFKNHGSFKLDQLKASLSTHTEQEVRSAITQALEWFATALNRDSGDSALWRQSAQLALVLSSARLARFALESVLDHETVGADASKDALSLVVGGNQNPEDQLASRQLRKILERIGDSMSISNKRLEGLSRTKLNKKFTKLLNPVPWLTVPSPESYKSLSVMIEQFSEKRRVINLTSRTWAAVGRAILGEFPDGNQDLEDVVPQPQPDTLQLVLPLYEGEEESRDTTPDQSSPLESGTKSEMAVVEDNEDVTMTDASNVLAPAGDRRRSGSANRKRKSTSMGVDGVDPGRSRLSKRQRDKKAADAAAAEAAASTPESRSKVRQDTQDEKLFNTADECFSPFGLSLGNASTLKINANSDGMDASDDSGSKQEKGDLFIGDFKAILQTWDDDKGNVILYGDGIQSPAEAAQGMSFLDLEANIPSRPLLAGDEGLRKWTRNVNGRGLCATQAAFEWLKALCKKDIDPRHKMSKHLNVSSGQSSWVKHSWPESLKSTALSITCGCEEICFQFFKGVEDGLNTRLMEIKTNYFTQDDYANVEFAQTVLELYLDDLASAKRDRNGGEISNESEVDLMIKRQRVLRWTYIVGDLMNHRPRDNEGQLEEDQLTLRYLWATTVMAGFTGNCSREFRLACFEDLKGLLAEREPPIDLPNSAVMPEISAARAEREISKLKTVDFFSTIFAATSESNEKDPGEVIEILEAVLEPGAVLPYDEEEERILREIGRFLEGSSAMFKLHLWEKLKAAYEKVNDPPKVLSCTLKCMQVVMSELKSRSYVDSSQDHRQFVLLRSLRLIQGMIGGVLEFLKVEHNIAELAEQELIDSLGSTLAMLRILHCYTFWESAVLKSEAKASDLHSYRVVVMKFKELLLQGWIIAYRLYAAMLNRGMGSDRENGWEDGEREEKLAGLLRDLHQELGEHHYCKLLNHVFLKLMFDELLKFNHRDYDGDLLQVIHCRFHLTLCQDQWYFFDHKTLPDPLDKGTALRLIDFVMYQASKKKTLQLTKSDLKTGLDKLVEVLGVPKPSNMRVAHNRAQIEGYLKSTLDPLKLFGCFKGRVDISTVEIFGECKEISSKGIYFLLGKVALYPLRYTKRVGVLRADELEAAMDFFVQDLICNPNNWETWYRVAQTFEIQMDEAQMWSAEHMNTKMDELIILERRTILSYMMAVSLAVRYAGDDTDTGKLLSELFTDFGYRMYSAGRPPMSLQSFGLHGVVRHFSGQLGQGLYTKGPHVELINESALRYALLLFQKALKDGDDNWKNHYMIGKCMGKLGKYRAEEVLGNYVEAIKLCPEKSSETIFEPHHKLISAATKYVLSNGLDPNRACEILKASRFSRGIDPVDTSASFVHYALEVLKKMKSADKPKWHHRMTNRIARLKHDQLNDVAGARAEFGALWSHRGVQLSIWKPEFERPGRHFIYASQYTQFYADLLEQVGDRTTMEALSKRLRRSPHGMYKHQDVWGHVFQKYIECIRRTGPVPNFFEDEVFKNVLWDEFAMQSQKLDACCNSPKESQSPALSLLREVFELRRLNGGLAKNTAIDDLLADTYAKLYQELVPGILEQEKEQQLNPMSLRNMMFDIAAPSSSVASNSAPGSMSGPPAGGVRMDVDLPLRAKTTKVYRRDLISKATNLCKEMNQAPATTTIAFAKPDSTAPNSPKPGDSMGGGGPESVGTGDEDTATMDLSALPNIMVVVEE